MSPTQELLWQKIQDFQLDDFDSTMTFTDRLCRENGWKYDFAVRAMHEYKKFMFLICTANHSLTPSDEVDQVWHLHLLYTQSYWNDFCKVTLGKEIHHGPTKGGKSEQNKFGDWYGKTKELYLVLFESEPPTDIWPPAAIRFTEVNFRRVNMHRNWIFPKFRKT